MKIIEFNPEERLYCSIAAAIIGGAAVSAGASMYGASKAADAQTDAANASIANQQQMWQQNRNILQPYIDAGTGQIPGLNNWLDQNNASSPLNALMKLTMPGADMTSTLEQTPGYQFNLNQGLRAANNALAARGLGGSGGAVAKGASSFASGLASNTWQSVVNSLQNVFTSGAGAKQNLVNTGASAGNALAGVGSNTANSISNSLIGAGNAQAAGYNAIGSAVGGLGNSLGTAAIVNNLTGRNGGTSVYGNSTWTPSDNAFNNYLFPGYGTG